MIYTNFRELDKAGRIVISKDIRKHFNIAPGDMLHIEADEKYIYIRRAEGKCEFCDSTENLKELNGKHICSACLEKLNG